MTLTWCLFLQQYVGTDADFRRRGILKRLSSKRISTVSSNSSRDVGDIPEEEDFEEESRLQPSYQIISETEAVMSGTYSESSQRQQQPSNIEEMHGQTTTKILPGSQKTGVPMQAVPQTAFHPVLGRAPLSLRRQQRVDEGSVDMSGQVTPAQLQHPCGNVPDQVSDYSIYLRCGIQFAAVCKYTLNVNLLLYGLFLVSTAF